MKFLMKAFVASIFLMNLAIFAAEKSPATNEMNVTVKGMVCSFCAQGIEKKFKEKKEVAEIQVSLEQKFVKIKFKDGMSLTQDEVKKIISDAGYEVEFKK